MSGDEEDADIEYVIEAYREEEIKSSLLSHLDVLKEKTINFEDLLNELVRHGALSFEEKFKTMSGIVDGTSSNLQTLPEKYHELYQTLLVRKGTNLTTLFKCWELTGNNYLVGRFDTHFTLEGRDSKSLKFTKFKALPSHRTEWLTHLHLRQLQLSPRALLKCLRKSNHLVSIRLERVRVPHGGRGADDPSTDFDQPLPLPNLKEFFFEEITKPVPFRSVKEINCFLDELNLRPILFFGLNTEAAWDSGVRINVKMRGVEILKMVPGGGEGGGGEFISMLRRRPVEYGGFINPENCCKIALYEAYVPKVPFCENITNLTLYRCKISQFDVLLSPCKFLEKATLYAEAEANSVSQIDLNCFGQSSASLKFLTLGYVSISLSNRGDQEQSGLNLDALCFDTCIIKLGEEELRRIFDKIDKLIVISCNLQKLELLTSPPCVVRREINIFELSLEEGEAEEALQPLGLSISALKKSRSFILERGTDGGDEWVVKTNKFHPLEVLFEVGGFSEFMGVGSGGSWFDLPIKTDGDDCREMFRGDHGY